VIHHVAAYSVDTFNMSTVPPSVGELVPKTARYSYGTFPGPMYDGAKAAMNFYVSVGPELIEKRVKYLSKTLMDGLMERNDRAKGPIIQILTPLEDISRGAQVGFTIKGLKETTETQIQSNTSNMTVTKPPTASQRFCDYARKNSVILRYVAENDIHCVRVSTHYYNNLKDLQVFFDVLDGFLKEEGWY
jgi:selenocysteine lyase/cysteine desulfurase